MAKRTSASSSPALSLLRRLHRFTTSSSCSIDFPALSLPSQTLAAPQSIGGPSDRSQLGSLRFAASMRDSSRRSFAVTVSELPLVGNTAPDFEAEAVFDQEFIKLLWHTCPSQKQIKGRACWATKKGMKMKFRSLRCFQVGQSFQVHRSYESMLEGEADELK
ncbi:uncharacterized protein A4U43_C02F15910, partial [Asparagus officinalis]